MKKLLVGVHLGVFKENSAEHLSHSEMLIKSERNVLLYRQSNVGPVLVAVVVCGAHSELGSILDLLLESPDSKLSLKGSFLLLPSLGTSGIFSTVLTCL